MVVYSRGREVHVPTGEDGRVDVQELRRHMGVAPGRTLIHQSPTGANTVVPSGGQVSLNPYESYFDAPRARRG